MVPGRCRSQASIKAKRGKGKTKVTITAFNLGANGAPGTLSAKVGKKAVAAFGNAHAEASVARDGWGAKITNVTASIGGKGAQALNRAFSGKSKGAKKSSGGRREGRSAARHDGLDHDRSALRRGRARTGQ